MLWGGLATDKTKRGYCLTKIAECGKKQKGLFMITKEWMRNKGEIILPSCYSDDNLAKGVQ